LGLIIDIGAGGKHLLLKGGRRIRRMTKMVLIAANKSSSQAQMYTIKRRHVLGHSLQD
jgi:hypothetical protein